MSPIEFILIVSLAIPIVQAKRVDVVDFELKEFPTKESCIHSSLMYFMMQQLPAGKIVDIKCVLRVAT